MSRPAASEMQRRRRRRCPRRAVPQAPPVARDSGRQRPEQMEGQRDVVRRQRPPGAARPRGAPRRRALRLEVSGSPSIAVRDDLPRPPDRRVVQQQVADGQDQAARRRPPHAARAASRADSASGFSTKRCLPAASARMRDRVVACRIDRDHDRRDLGIRAAHRPDRRSRARPGGRRPRERAAPRPARRSSAPGPAVDSRTRRVSVRPHGPAPMTAIPIGAMGRMYQVQRDEMIGR